MSSPNSKDYQPVEMEEGVITVADAQVIAEDVMPSPTNVIMKATAVPMIEVVAPATLPEGYSFEAEIGGRVITVTVPLGGVEEGQSFMVPAKTVAGGGTPRSHIPFGEWRDGICNCCVNGCCHAQLCLTMWCGPCALGQVMQRMNLSWYGGQAGPATVSVTCRTVAYLFAAYILCDYILAIIETAILPHNSSTSTTNPYHTNTNNPQGDIPPIFYLFYGLRATLHIVFFFYMMIAIVNTRQYIRTKYAIREGSSCRGMEDCCCAFWCQCCTIMQMARHTADYETYNASCCTTTGLPPTVPAIV